MVWTSLSVSRRHTSYSSEFSVERAGAGLRWLACQEAGLPCGKHMLASSNHQKRRWTIYAKNKPCAKHKMQMVSFNGRQSITHKKLVLAHLLQRCDQPPPYSLRQSLVWVSSLERLGIFSAWARCFPWVTNIHGVGWGQRRCMHDETNWRQ